MKVKIALLMLIIIIFTSSCSKNSTKKPGANSTSFYERIAIDCTYEPFDIAIDNNIIYIADKDNIYFLDSETKSTVIKDLSFCRNIAISKDELYAYDSKENILKIYKNHILSKQVELGVENIVKMDCINDNLLLLQSEQQDFKKKLYLFELNGEMLNEINVDNIISFSKYKENSILILTGDIAYPDTELVIYDTSSFKVTASKSTKIPFYINDMSYNSVNNTLYYVSSNMICEYSISDSKTNTLYLSSDISSSKENNSQFMKIESYGGKCVAIDTKNEELFVVNVDSLKSRESINILLTSNVDFRLNYSLMKMQKEHPDIDITFTNIDKQMYYTRLQTKLMANDYDFDIFEINGNLAYKYLRNNAIDYLQEYPELLNKFKSMFNGIRNLCSYNGNLFGIPTYFSVTAWSVDSLIKEELNADIPKTPWTWDDFYNYSKDILKQKSAEKHSDVFAANGTDLFYSMLYSYDINMDLVSKNTCYNTEEFKNILQLYKKMIQDNLVGNGRHLFNEISLNLYVSDSSIIYPPTLNNAEIYQVDTNLLCLNKYSKHKTASTLFLTEYISEDVQISGERAIQCLYSDIDLYKKAIKKHNSNTGDNVLLSKENYNKFSYMLKHSAQNSIILNGASVSSEDPTFTFLAERHKIIERFRDDEISICDALKLIDEKAQFILND